MLVAESVKGFSKLSSISAETFKAFLENFYKAWGSEVRKSIEPISVKFVNEKGAAYLRFDYKMNGRKEWLHVTGPTTWF